MDTSIVGITAAKLMDTLADGDLPADARIVGVGLVVELEYEDPEDVTTDIRDVQMQCSIDDRVKQVGLFEIGKTIALDSEPE